MITVTSKQMNVLNNKNNSSTIIRCPKCEALLKIKEIKKTYTTPDDDVVKWPSIIGIPLPFKNVIVTKKEADLLDSFLNKESLWKIFKMSELKELSFKKADEAYSRNLERPSYVPENRYNEWKLNDGHNDAFRHAYWNALMARHLGQDFASQFATAHEGLPNNPQDRETMDLYNNSVGRQIAADNPNATDDELAQLIGDAVKDGKMLIFNEKSELSWSNDVAYGKHGLVIFDDAGSGS